MKKLIILPLMFLLLLGLGGCTKSISIGSIENSTDHKMSASYLSFTGTKEHEITVDEGETLEISVDVTTKDGTLDAYIYNKDEEYSYEGHDIQTSSFTVTLTEAGDYTIKVDSDKHRGSYSFSWE